MCDGLVGIGVCVKEAGKAFGLKSKYSFYQKFETQETSFLQTANILTYLKLKLFHIFVKECKKEQERCMPGLDQCCKGLMCRPDIIPITGVCIKESGKAFGLKSKYSFY